MSNVRDATMTRLQASPPRAAEPDPVSAPPNDDSLAPARGILAGVALALPLWVLIGLLIAIGIAP